MDGGERCIGCSHSMQGGGGGGGMGKRKEGEANGED